MVKKSQSTYTKRPTQMQFLSLYELYFQQFLTRTQVQTLKILRQINDMPKTFSTWNFATTYARIAILSIIC